MMTDENEVVAQILGGHKLKTETPRVEKIDVKYGERIFAVKVSAVGDTLSALQFLMVHDLNPGAEVDCAIQEHLEYEELASDGEVKQLMQDLSVDLDNPPKRKLSTIDEKPKKTLENA